MESMAEYRGTFINNPKHLILGLFGFAGSGKDEIAKYLIANYGFSRIAFADKVREFMYAADPCFYAGEGYFQNTYYLKDFVDRWGWEEVKKLKSGRELMQRFGTEAGRNVLGEDVWVNAAITQMKAEQKFPYVITDIRFPNEIKALQDFMHLKNSYEVIIPKVLIAQVIRPNVEAPNNHVSESLYSTFPADVQIRNNGSMEDLHWGVSTLMAKVWGEVF